ncbi:prepilin-type N-terminal cleavage/methylation domain-containing protein [Candidatus Gracilibacteria bacterium]|nr:prepilin-type N-terminal cleavage/methylation domain-containing protein [Candidatus Gracilibacteria bacterium]
MKIKNIPGFTLVELVVIITILGILSTIAFIAFQEYPLFARNGKRVADIADINTSLDLFFVSTGEYPVPSNSFEVTYSGALVWKQGTFGESVVKNVGNISNIPLDPFTQNEYTYSITSHGTEYEISSIEESGNLVSVPNKTYAANTYAKVSGNYNGKILKTSYAGNDMILALPSITTSESENTTIHNILSNQSLVFDGYENIPSSYHASERSYKSQSGLEYNPISIVVFEGKVEDLYDSYERTQLGQNVQNAYAGTDLYQGEKYREIVHADIENITHIMTNAIAFNEGGIIVPGIDKSSWKDIQPNFERYTCQRDLTQEEVDELNSIMGDSKSISDWCSRRALRPTGRGLTEIPSAVFKMTNLEDINLWGNNITHLPPEIGNLTKLRYLNLQHSDITILPPEIGNLVNLNHLILSDNNIINIPPEIGNLTNLFLLALDRNEISYIPQEIERLNNLYHLQLADNNLTSLPEQLWGLTGLTYLSLNRNQLETIPQQVSNLTNLTDLYFGQLWHGGNNIIDIPESLWTMTHLQYLKPISTQKTLFRWK